ncbi:unnamed protein product [Caenorhabditis auriculariae]|uniref:BPTI/Kunitz inhibitor domain-containing protein n=1 Tax=Caenorhabditis auriculariae TaxID=2777116 RepID=A0A8S1HSN5_9PELO|nr:unnamed protein product [Caenorhabditis auriculariae]
METSAVLFFVKLEILAESHHTQKSILESEWFPTPGYLYALENSPKEERALSQVLPARSRVFVLLAPRPSHLSVYPQLPYLRRPSTSRFQPYRPNNESSRQPLLLLQTRKDQQTATRCDLLRRIVALVQSQNCPTLRGWRQLSINRPATFLLWSHLFTRFMLLTALVVLVLSAETFARSRLPNPPVFAAVETFPSICYLPPDSGLCKKSATLDSSELDLITRYYFDTATEQCYPFGVQHCGGNENRFANLEDCQKLCVLSGKK